jgi:GDP-L-fucose synthase
MDALARIYIAGHTGLVGSALVRALRAAGYRNLILRSHQELDLTDQDAVRQFFSRERPEYVVLAAAKVGGIFANNRYPADFIGQNLAIQNNVIHEAHISGVRRFLFLGSSCIYPRCCLQPIKEEYFLTGPLEVTNRSYAVAKIAGIEMCSAYNRQYGTRFLAAMPTNLYGKGDNHDLETSHVVPALIRKMTKARQAGEKAVIIWGTGTPRREFMLSDDMADACLYLMGLPNGVFEDLAKREPAPLINIGCGQDLTIRELAEMIAAVVGFTGRLTFDSSKPDGTPRKLLDCSRLTSLGWQAATPLPAGLQQVCEHFRQEHLNLVS